LSGAYTGLNWSTIHNEHIVENVITILFLQVPSRHSFNFHYLSAALGYKLVFDTSHTLDCALLYGVNPDDPDMGYYTFTLTSGHEW